MTGGTGAPADSNASRAPAASAAPAVLVMARAPRRGEVRRALEPLLGADGCFALQTALVVQTLAWAHAVAPGAVHVAHDPPDAARALRTLAPADTAFLPQNGEGIARRLADAVTRVFGHHSGPLLVVWPDLPRLRPEHAWAALSDLADGCDAVFGPKLEGGLYLLGLPGPRPRLFELPEQAWRSSDAMMLGLAAARDAGLEVGLLRAERPLGRPADIRAALADPLLPGELRRILAGREDG